MRLAMQPMIQWQQQQQCAMNAIDTSVSYQNDNGNQNDNVMGMWGVTTQGFSFGSWADTHTFSIVNNCVTHNLARPNPHPNCFPHSTTTMCSPTWNLLVLKSPMPVQYKWPACFHSATQQHSTVTTNTATQR